MKVFTDPVALINLVFIVICTFAVLIICAGQYAEPAARDGFIQAVEMQMQVHPGDTKVWPLCQCSVRYIGTNVHGKRYTVTIDKLD